ncbi:MAG: 2-C-methyl-D-erythritol 2,4-cyclodiphosphate synthase [Alphaproteobacteria bacterium]
MPNIALLMAAGQSTRMRHERTKPYRLLVGEPVLRVAAQQLLKHGHIDYILPVIRAEDLPLCLAALDGLPNILAPVNGGATRQESVRLGLEALAGYDAHSTVLIHDVARPFTPAPMISRLLTAMEKADAALPFINMPDTLRRLDGDGKRTIVPREGVESAQTPQCFRLGEILAAHRQFAATNVTDDITLMGLVGKDNIAYIEGSVFAFKITNEEDLLLAETIMKNIDTVPDITPSKSQKQLDIRVGHGVDIHPFAAGRPMILGGVNIPCDMGLAGHSDADVLLHAITDALLGTIGEGDIGTHFPPSDARWKNADSEQFLRHALSLVAEKGGRLHHVDSTILAEKPKIAPYRAAIRQHIATMLGLDIQHVSVKATTTEKLGFVGREEGVLAESTVTVYFYGN